MKKYLLTHGDKTYQILLDTIREWNEKYCKQFNYLYVECNRTTDFNPELPQSYYWEKYRLIVQVMNICQNGDFICFLDCDAFIKKFLDFYEELCSNHGFLNYDIAASKYPDIKGFAGWNLGSIFINVNDRTRNYFKTMLSRGSVPKEEWPETFNQTIGWEEQRMIADMDEARAVASDEKDFREQFDKGGEEKIRTPLNLDSQWNYGHAIRPLVGDAFDKAIIVHAAEKPLAYKTWFLQESIKRVKEGKLPVNPTYEFKVVNGVCVSPAYEAPDGVS
jgi:hypothetical protein